MIWRFIIQKIKYLMLVFFILIAPDVNFASSLKDELKFQVQKNEKNNEMVLRGQGNWLQLNSSLRFASHDVFWGDKSTLASKARDLKTSDPLPAILDFNSKLKSNNIKLILVPIPVKAALYPEFLIPRLISRHKFDGRLDAHLKKFVGRLNQEGINVIDLYDVFKKNKGIKKIYCETDSHWSSHAAFMAAKQVANLIEKLDPSVMRDGDEFQMTKEGISIVGDLSKILNEKKEESSQIIKILPEGKTLSPDSSVLVLGDSHTLAFHDGGDFHSKGAGFPDHLAFHIGQPVDLLGVRGSASTVSRIKMLRQNRAKGKKIVVWIFSSREFTESPVGWKKLPVIR